MATQRCIKNKGEYSYGRMDKVNQRDCTVHKNDAEHLPMSSRVGVSPPPPPSPSSPVSPLASSPPCPEGEF